MTSVTQLAFDRQQRMITVTDTTRARALQAWKSMDFQNLDQSWAQISSQLVAQVSAAQLALAQGSDRFTAQVATSTPDFTPDRSAIVPEAFSGVDGVGRDVNGILLGAVTTTKEAVGSGLGSIQSLEAGATYLAAIIKTVVADLSRSADLSSSAGKGYTHYVRVCNGSACSRCAILSGISSGQEAFARHLSCQCSAVPVYSKGSPKAPTGLHASPQEYFDSLSKEEQDRVFTKAGAEAIRAGADPVKVVNARRGANGIGYSGHSGLNVKTDPRGHYVKTTIGVRPDGTPVQVYTTTEGTTARGQFGKANLRTSEIRKAAGQRYSTTARIRLMPETIMQISGNDLALRQAFLRDAGYIEYRQPVFNAKTYFQDIEAQKRADRILVDRATARFGNFYLG